MNPTSVRSPIICISDTVYSCMYDNVLIGDDSMIFSSWKMYNGITKAQTETASNDACVNITSNIQLT